VNTGADNDMELVRAIMKAIFGTDAKCRHQTERAITDKMLAQVERKVERLDAALDGRPAKNMDEALQQLTEGRYG
jgi:hypothetical protein